MRPRRDEKAPSASSALALKSVLSVAPIYLHDPKRVAALLFVYFLAVLVFALIERQARLGMKKRELESIPLYTRA